MGAVVLKLGCLSQSSGRFCLGQTPPQQSQNVWQQSQASVFVKLPGRPPAREPEVGDQVPSRAGINAVLLAVGPEGFVGGREQLGFASEPEPAGAGSSTGSRQAS